MRYLLLRNTATSHATLVTLLLKGHIQPPTFHALENKEKSGFFWDAPQVSGVSFQFY